MAARGVAVQNQSERKKKLDWLEAEKMRVQIELQSSHDISPHNLPPSGVIFDTVPNVADEFAYDALEKAYNASFEVYSSERRSCLPRDWGIIPSRFTHTNENAYKSSRDDCEAPTLMDRKRQAVDPMLVETAMRDMEWSEKEKSNAHGRKDPLHTMKENPVLTLECVEYRLMEGEKHESGEKVWEDHVIRSEPSVVDKAVEMSEKREKKTEVLSQRTVACKQEDIETTAPPPEELSKTSSHVMTHQTSVKEASSDLKNLVLSRPTDSLMSATDENKALNDFLVIELSLFVACLLNDRWEMPNVDHLAAVTAIQLCRNHRSAVSDFDAERNRVRGRAKRNRMLGRTPKDTGNLKKTIKGHPEVNPFQLELCEPVNESDESLRDTTKSSSTEYTNGDDSVVDTTVKSSSADQTNGHDGVADTTVWVEIDRLRKRGLNALLLHDDDPSQAVLQMQSMLASNAYPGAHLVITSTDSFDRWHQTLAALSTRRARVFPCSVPQSERLLIYQTISQDHLCGETLIVLVNFEHLLEDGIALALCPWQSCIVDLSTSTWQIDTHESAWLCLVSILSRQRILLCNQVLSVDVRLLVQFLFPTLTSSRRKLMAWNCAAFDELSIRAICTVVLSCAVLVDTRVSRETLQLHLVNATRAKSTLELTTLDTLQRAGMVKSCTDFKLEKLCARNSRPWSGRPRGSNGMEARKKLHKRILSPGIVAGELLKSSPRAKKIPPRRRGVPNESTPRSRKRISRCGKCAGCLAEDCMVCGHCQDMKKYGGPGLRKQSCKHRKCVNPKSWGLTSKKSRRGAKDPSMGESVEAGVLVGGSDRDDSETDECVGLDAEDGADTDSSQESDQQSVGVKVGSSSSGNQDISKKMKTENALPGVDDDDDDSDGQDVTSSGTEGSRDRSKASRKRVMRCGNCKGCTSEDCMTCNHCLDMKKYGGPGLRKQSCKNRKCVVPKMVMLNNQAKEEWETLDETEVLNFERPAMPSLLKQPSEQLDQWTRKPQFNWLHLEQECMVVVRRQLRFPCGFCSAAFCTLEQRTYHNAVKHSTEKAESEWELEADLLLQQPRYQLGLILTSIGLASGQVRAYAKLKGDDFEFYLLYPQVVLGRMSAQWNDLYRRYGIDDTKGLSAGWVDCHVGHDTMIDSQHVRIYWDVKERSFMVECLSLRSPISINGHELRYGTSPLKLRSHDLVQMGASTFYFLLPRMDSGHLKRTASTAIPLSEMEQWLHSRVTKQRLLNDQAHARDSAH